MLAGDPIVLDAQSSQVDRAQPRAACSSAATWSASPPAPRTGPVRADAGAEGGGRAGFAAARGWRPARAGRRPELLAQQVQPRHAGAAPAGLELQALPVLGGVRTRLHAGFDRARCAGGVPRPRRPRLAAAERQRQVLRPDAHARSAGAVAQPGVGAPARRDRRGFRAQVHHPVRLQAREPAAEPVDVAGHRFADADLGRARLLGVRQRRLPGRALFHRPGASTATAWSSRSTHPPRACRTLPAAPGDRDARGRGGGRLRLQRRRAHRDHRRGRGQGSIPTPVGPRPRALAPRAIDERTAFLASLADARRRAARHRHRGQGARARRTSAARPARPTTIATPGSPASAATW